MTEDIKMLRAAAEAGYVPLRDYIEAVEGSAIPAKLAECERASDELFRRLEEKQTQREAAADAKGLTLSAYVRMVALDAAKKDKK